MKALVFTSHDLADLYDAAEQLVLRLRERDVEAALVDKLSAKPADLVLLAEHGVVEPLVFLLLDGSGVRVRLVSLPGPDQVLEAVRRLHTSD
jgi:hypothetical protein